MNNQETLELFLSPNEQFRGKPFWSWNGKLDESELIRQIHIFKEMGFGGFFMHSRTGLVTEYLGDEWFQLINRCAEEAEKLGMEAWLYDEDRWPSGTAGGMVTKNPNYRLKFICLEIEEQCEWKWEENTVAAFLSDVEGVTYTECEQIDENTLIQVGTKKKILHFKIVELEQSSFYNGFTYVDTLNLEATQAFITSTHEKYKKHCGHHFGKTIKGIFTDEPHRGALLDGFSIPNERGEWHVPWSYNVFEEFKKRYGYDVIPKLPELFLQPHGYKVSQVKWHYIELLQQLFLENFAKPIYDWCKENHLLLTGHILHEDNLGAQTAMCGSVMRYYEYMDYPGVDVLGETNRQYCIVKQLASVARQEGKKWLLSELYGCTGWQMNFESHKAVGDWQALLGINLRCHHLSWYTMEGEAKRDFPASIHFQSSWWKEYKMVEEYFSRFGVLTQQGKSVCNTLVIHPVESVWCQVYPGWSKSLIHASEEVDKLEKDFEALLEWLLSGGIDFDYGDEGIISQKAGLIIDKGVPYIKIGEATYKTVIIGTMTTIRRTTLTLLQSFYEIGGQIIFTGTLPGYVDALPSIEVKDFAEKSKYTRFLKEEILDDFFDLNRKPAIQILDRKGSYCKEIFSQVRENEGSYYYGLVNVNPHKSFENVQIIIPQEGNLQLWDCLTGERYQVPLEKVERGWAIRASFLPSESKWYVMVPQKENLPIIVEQKSTQSILLEGPFSYKLTEPNICVLDQGRYSWEGGSWEEEQEILKIDRQVRKNNKMNLRGGEMLQPWYTQKTERDIKGVLKLAFDFYIQDIPMNSCYLVIEEPENFLVTINHTGIKKEVEGWFIDPSMKKILIPRDALELGKNTIYLETKFREDVNLEALYLVGDFGVKIQEMKKIITNLPTVLEAKDVVCQGLPFYSGSIIYHISPDFQALEKGKWMIEIPDFQGACIKITRDQKEIGFIPWQPYVVAVTNLIEQEQEFEIEVILTRRNTFGPLHQVPLYSLSYGPDNFITEGKNFSHDYQLIPSGILKGLTLKRMEK